MKVVILAGGGGTRLFPLSRVGYPKQFLNIDSDVSLLGQTIDRFLHIVSSKDILIITGEKYYSYVKTILEMHNSLDSHIITEPCAKNTAPAIALILKYLIDEMSVSLDESVFVAPSDHIIKTNEEFKKFVLSSNELVKNNYVVAMGIKPIKAEIGYGYILKGEKLHNGYKVDKFIEKPTMDKAVEFVDSGNYFWNSGMYTFKIGTFVNELKKHNPSNYNIFSKYKYSDLLLNFKEFESISIDYAISEKSDIIAMVPMSIYWNDVGSWDSIFEMMEKDKEGNVKIGDCSLVECKNSFIMSNKKLVTGIGLNNLIIVETDDVIMVSQKGETQKVKELVDQMKGRVETKEHTTIYREWGYSKRISEAEKYRVNKIVINPNNELSFHYHNERSEHWMIVAGIASVILGDDEREFSNNESIFIPNGIKHKLINRGNIPLEIIEVQNGQNFGEDDIIEVEMAVIGNL